MGYSFNAEENELVNFWIEWDDKQYCELMANILIEETIKLPEIVVDKEDVFFYQLAQTHSRSFREHHGTFQGNRVEEIFRSRTRRRT